MGNNYSFTKNSIDEESYKKACEYSDIDKIKALIFLKRVKDDTILNRIEEICSIDKLSKEIREEILYYIMYYKFDKRSYSGNEKKIKEILNILIKKNQIDLFKLKPFETYLEKEEMNIECVNMACTYNNFEVLKHVLEIKNNINECDKGFFICIKNNNCELVSYFILKGYNVSKKDNFAIKYCILNGYDSIAKKIVEDNRVKSEIEKNGLCFDIERVYRMIQKEYLRKTNSCGENIESEEEIDYIQTWIKENKNVSYVKEMKIVLYNLSKENEKNRNKLLEEYKKINREIFLNNKKMVIV